MSPYAYGLQQKVAHDILDQGEVHKQIRRDKRSRESVIEVTVIRPYDIVALVARLIMMQELVKMLLLYLL